jgi:hypothetical protein
MNGSAPMISRASAARPSEPFKLKIKSRHKPIPKIGDQTRPSRRPKKGSRKTPLTSQLAYVGMKARGFGRIINISSNLTYKGAPGLARYSAAKAAEDGFMRA